jgi:DNA-directed RNA polymerase specialized sigma24 family protein
MTTAEYDRSDRELTMDEQRWLVERFEDHRPHLQAVAYRMLGSLGEAEDAVQETWLRIDRADVSEVDNLGGWLTTVAARVCLDMLRARKARREEYLGDTVAEADTGSPNAADPSKKRYWPTRWGWR